MGAAYDPTGDTSSEDRGGSSLAATLATSTRRRAATPTPGSRPWRPCPPGRLRPLRAIPSTESDTGIPDPRHNVAPVPDYTRVCAAGGHRRLPGLHRRGAGRHQPCPRARRHPAHGAARRASPQLSVPDQLFVAVNLERVDRGLPAFGGLTTALNRNAQQGADDANDPPDPGQAYDLDDAEWAGGSSNGLDAVYGWMYDDGFDSGNLDCLRRGAAGLLGPPQGHPRRLRLRAPHLVMGAAIAITGDTHDGDARRHLHGGHAGRRRTHRCTSFTYSWAQVDCRAATWARPDPPRRRVTCTRRARSPPATRRSSTSGTSADAVAAVTSPAAGRGSPSPLTLSPTACRGRPSLWWAQHEMRRTVTASLVFYGILGIASTVAAFAANRRLFSVGAAGPVTLLEGVYYAVGACSLLLGWYFNVRYVHLYGHRASYSNYVRMLFTNWAADSAAQDYTIVNLVLLPLWTITEGTWCVVEMGLIFFGDEPFDEPGVLRGLLPRLHGAPAALQPVAGTPRAPRSRSCSRG